MSNINILQNQNVYLGRRSHSFENGAISQTNLGNETFILPRAVRLKKEALCC